jgi:hypothetical protein
MKPANNDCRQTARLRASAARSNAKSHAPSRKA